MGRPALPPEQRPVKRTIRLSPDLADYAFRLARQRGQSEYAFLGGIVDRVLEHYKTREASRVCYGAASTLSDVLSESPSSSTVKS